MRQRRPRHEVFTPPDGQYYDGRDRRAMALGLTVPQYERFRWTHHCQTDEVRRTEQWAVYKAGCTRQTRARARDLARLWLADEAEAALRKG